MAEKNTCCHYRNFSPCGRGTSPGSFDSRFFLPLVIMMPINTTLSFVGYKIFSKDSALDLTPSVPFVVRSTHLTYYVVAVCVLLFTFVLRTSRRKDGVNAPFYKASKMKWMFDAESLIRDSYVKVGSHRFMLHPSLAVRDPGLQY